MRVRAATYLNVMGPAAIDVCRRARALVWLISARSLLPSSQKRLGRVLLPRLPLQRASLVSYV